MKTYLIIDEFCRLTHLNKQTVGEMINKGSLKAKIENNKIYVETDENSLALGAKTSINNEIVEEKREILSGASFIEKTIGTILNMHEKVIDAKDETLEALKNENSFLKEALYSMQELYDEDRKTVENLNTQLKLAQEEVEFLRRKYKLMWDKPVENFSQMQKIENT